MAICPECRASYGDDLQTCPEHGCDLVPGGLFLPEDAPLAAGTMVGEYRIDCKLGAGSFGDVYAGEQPLIGKRVAVKILNHRFASDPVVVSRFIAEARAVNKIRQRNIIDIFSFGVLPGLDRHYFVMELLDGLTLGELMDRSGRLPIGVVLPIVRGIAEGLDAVHEASITHRDLKPDNVFLATERDGSYFPKLLDFGIAKLVGDDVAHRTGPGTVMGTPRYMSPEQARGKPTDHRADIYALGVMIHEMLTGVPLFTGESGVDVLLRHASDCPPRMSNVCPELPPELDAPVLAMLEKRPQDRPSSAGQAVTALAACAQMLGVDREVALGPTSPRAAVAEARQRHEAAGASSTFVLDRRLAQGAAARRVDAKLVGAEVEPGQPRAILGETRRSSSSLEAASTLASDPAIDGADLVRRSPRSTDGFAAVETSSAQRRLGGARRFRLIAGASALLAVGVSIWAVGRVPPATTVESLPLVPSDAGESRTPIARPHPSTDEPLVRADVAASTDIVVRLTARPADAEVWLGDRKLGVASAPVTLPRGTERVELRLKKVGFKEESVGLMPDRDQALEATLAPLPGHHEASAAPKPSASASAGRMNRILGDRD